MGKAYLGRKVVELGMNFKGMNACGGAVSDLRAPVNG
jgi:hypothetical protein